MSIDTYIRMIDREATNAPGNEGDLFRDYLPRKGVVLLMGPSGVGKSFWALSLAASLATGQSAALAITGETNQTVFAKPIAHGATVYIAGEGAEGLPKRIAACELAYGCGDPNANDISDRKYLPIIPIGVAGSRLTGADQVFGVWQRVSDRIEAGATYGLPVRLLVFDTLIATFNVRDENSNAEMQAVVTSLRRYAEKFDCLALAIVHPGKGRGSRRRGVRGASALTNGADVVLSLEKNRDARRRLTVIKMRDSQAEGRRYDFELMPFGASAVMSAIAGEAEHDVETHTGQSSLSARSVEMLTVIERACHVSKLSLENFVGLRLNAASLVQITNAWTATDTSQASSKPEKANTLRKRIERLLPELIREELIEKAMHNGKAYYLPTVAWPDMTAAVEATFPGSNYASTLAHEAAPAEERVMTFTQTV